MHGIPADEIVDQDGLLLHVHPDYDPRIIVPLAQQEDLIRQHHADLFHLGSDKTAHSLRKAYYWPKLGSKVRNVLADCPTCELAKAQRNAAHNMYRARPLSGPRSKICMGFQGQCKAITGHVEACAIIDEFSRFVTAIPLHSRSATEFAPQFMDAWIWRQGPPGIIHSDAAKTFTSRFMQCLSDTYGIQRTTTLGHNPTGNAMVEVFWRFWNRCMRILTDEQIRHWPEYTQRICFAYNSVVHDSIQCSPFELHHGVPARNPLAPATYTDLDQQLRDFNPLDPREYAEAVRASVQAFTALAKCHSDYVQATTAERLNMSGHARTYQIGGHVKVLVPTTAEQIAATGRPAKHLFSWRGPCEIIEVLSDTAYAMKELRTNRRFERTAINIRQFHATTPIPEPAPTLAAFAVAEIIAIRDAPGTRFYIATVTELMENALQVHYLGCQSANLRTAVFRKCWSHAPSATITLSHTPPRQCTPWLGELDYDAMDELLVARDLQFTGNHRLTAGSVRRLTPVADEIYVFPR